MRRPRARTGPEQMHEAQRRHGRDPATLRRRERPPRASLPQPAQGRGAAAAAGAREARVAPPRPPGGAPGPRPPRPPVPARRRPGDRRPAPPAADARGARARYVDRMDESSSSASTPSSRATTSSTSTWSTTASGCPRSPTRRSTSSSPTTSWSTPRTRSARSAQHTRVLRPGGVLFLANPDPRETFDRDRPLTTIEHLARDHRDGPAISRQEHYDEWVRVVERAPEPEVAARSAALRDASYSIHFHVWTPSVFAELVSPLRPRGGHPARARGRRPRPPRVHHGAAKVRRHPLASPRRMPKSALITGITGQDGSYLAELLLEKGYEVHGMVRRASTEKFDRIEHLRDRITLHQGDLLDHRSLTDTLRASKPEEIYNLAAMSFVAVSWIQPTLTAEFTGVGVTRLLEAMREVCPEARFYQALLGDVRQGPRGPADGVDAVLPALALRRGEGLRALHHRQLPRVLRPARDERDPLQPRVAAPRAGVRHPQGHVARRGDQARQARRARASATSTPSATGATPPTTSRRCSSCCSATSPRTSSSRPARCTPSATACEIAFDEAGVPRLGEARRHRPAFLRPAEVDELVGDSAKAKELLGWEPGTSFEELIRLMTRADLELLKP